MAKRGRKSIHELMKDKFDCNYGTINGKYSKYKRGEVITDIKTLLEQKVIIWIDTTKNIEMLKSLPLRVILRSLERKCFYYAIPKEKKEKSGKAEIIIRDDNIQTSYTLVTFPNEKYFLKFKCDNFMIEITEEQFREICLDMRFENIVKSEGGAICYTPLAQRIRNEYIAKKFNGEE